MSDSIAEHYERVATRYDEHWTYDPDYVARLSRSMLDALRLTAGDAIADVGCGTGLYARELARELRPSRPLLCVDPVAAMLDQVPVSPGLRRLQASAEDLASGRVPLPEPMDAILLKESVHHLEAWRETLAGLTTLLSRRGRLLVVMLPTVIEHPLFRAAHELFRDRQPEPSAVEGALTAAGLRATTSYRTFHVAIERDRYVRMLEERYMSVLSDFSEAELNAGIDQFRSAYRDPVLRFDDRFALVSGWVAHH